MNRSQNLNGICINGEDLSLSLAVPVSSYLSPPYTLGTTWVSCPTSVILKNGLSRPARTPIYCPTNDDHSHCHVYFSAGLQGTKVWLFQAFKKRLCFQGVPRSNACLKQAGLAPYKGWTGDRMGHLTSLVIHTYRNCIILWAPECAVDHSAALRHVVAPPYTWLPVGAALLTTGRSPDSRICGCSMLLWV